MDETFIMTHVGETGLRNIVRRFYEKIKDDDLIGPMYPKRDLVAAEERLFLFFMFRFAGDPRYMEARGHPRLRGRHTPFPIGIAARDRWMDLMNASMQEEGLDETSYSMLSKFFAQIADFMRNKSEGGIHFEAKPQQ